MGNRQFRQSVQTDADVSVNTAEETYRNATALREDGQFYPYALGMAPDSEGMIQEITILNAGNIVMTLGINDPDSADYREFRMPLEGGMGVFDRYEVSFVEFSDPDGTQAPLSVLLSTDGTDTPVTFFPPQFDDSAGGGDGGRGGGLDGDPV